MDLANNTAIIVLGGAFSPIHAGHIAAIDTARKHLQSLDIVVLACFLAPAPDGYVFAKYKNNAMPAKHRLPLCNLMSPDFIKPTTQTYGSAGECIMKMLPQYPTGTQPYIVVGADRAKIRAKPTNIKYLAVDRTSVKKSETLLTAPAMSLAFSATFVRNKLCTGCTDKHSLSCELNRPDAISQLVIHGVINIDVANYLLHNPGAIPFVVANKHQTSVQ